MQTLANHLTQIHRKWKVPLLAVIAIMMYCQSAMAQSGAGSIQGTVVDATGAVIPGASIRVANQATGVVTNTKSNNAGFYEAPGLFSGTYVVTFSSPNMKTYVRNIQLLVDQHAVINPVMTAGPVTEQVEVSAGAVQLATYDSGATSSTLENERINQLPINGRQIIQLAQMTTPGLEGGMGAGTRANGLVGEALEYVADGVPLLNRNFGGPNVTQQSQFPDPDAVQEVRMEISGGGAQFATPATGIITTKSGTNSLHGTAFWTGRNNAVGIARGRQNPSTFVAPPFKRNEFGVSAGGPVILPRLYHGKDKTFWFLAFERYSLIQTTVAPYAVDTPAMKNGDFSGLINGSGVLQQLYDPSTTYNTNGTNCPATGAPNAYCRTPFANNQIPIGRLNKVAKVIYDMTPAPNIAGVNPLVAPNYNWPGPNNFIVPTVTWRLDHSFSETDKAYMRYTSNLQTDQYPGGAATTLAAAGIPAMAASSETIAPATNFAGAIGYTHVFSPTFFSETVASQQWFAQKVTATGNPRANYEAQLGLPNNFGQTGMPNIGGFIMPHGGNQFNYGINQIITNLDENLTKTLSKHQMMFGFRYRHERLGYQPDQSQDQNVADNLSTALYNPATGGNYGALANTGHSSADAFLGSMYNFTVNILPPYTHFMNQEFDAYFQDNWHVRKSLTLNLGLRYEAHPAMSSGGIGTSFDLVHSALVLQKPTSYYIAKGLTTQAIITNMQNIGAKFETPAEAGFPSTMLRSYNFTFGPRVGFAWQPFQSKYGTVVRGSYGRYIFPEALRNVIGMTRDLPFFTSYGYNNNSAAQSPDGQPNYELRNPQNIFLGQNTANIVNSSTINSILPGVGGTFYNPDFPPEFVTETNFTVEQPFKDNSVLRVTWNWTHATNLTNYYYPNLALSTFVWEYDTGTLPPNGGPSTIGTNQYATTALNPYNNITYGNLAIGNRMGWSNDHSLQVNYQKLFHRGIAYQAMYVWSKPMRVGGNSTRDTLSYPIQQYPGVLGTAPGASYAPLVGGGPMTQPAAPPLPPKGIAPWAQYKELLRFQDYKQDTYNNIPRHHVTVNGIFDLPVGRGKRFLGNSNRLVDEVIGGFQIAGSGQVVSQDFAPNTGNWGQTNPLVIYRHGVPITDCSSGVCRKAFMWFNGYVSPKLLPASNGGTCTSNCVTGLPSSYKPYQTPINNDPNFPANFGNNNVALTVPTLNGGQPITIAFAPDSQQTYAGNNRYNKSILNGPFNYNVDLSVFKTFPINEKVNFRVNLDAFNALNIQGYNNPNTTNGVEAFLPGGVGASSYWTPRNLQLTMRLTF